MRIAKLIKRKKPSKLSIIGAVFQNYNYLGLVGAVIFFCLSLLPSLLPRPWLFQGFVSGFSTAIGYGCGVAVSALWRWLIEYEFPKKAKRVGWITLAAVAPLVATVYIFLSTNWQNQVRVLVDEPVTNNRFVFRILVATILVSALLLYTARALRWITQYIITQIDRILPRKVSIIAGVVVVVYLTVMILNGLMFSSFVRFANNSYSKRNSSTLAGVVQPMEAERSGSPKSLAAWNTLGYQGRSFVGRGPSQAQLAQVHGGEVKQPIRVYVGLETANSAEARATLAVEELERTGAFNRKILVIGNATGTGWLEPQSVDSLEYMYGGDSAIASIQYSYLPSWLSFLVDKQNAKDAGQQLFNAVYGKWASLPAGSRPKLITYGLSLGSYAGQSAFSGANDIKYTTDGALFIGTPSDTELWKSISDNRDAGSSQVQPVYQHGKTVRFAAKESNTQVNQIDWPLPHVLYLQHPSDPVVWFNFNLALNEPDWLQEKRGADVSPSMHWYPFVTCVQVAIDQFLGTSAPNGHGHNYADNIVAAWAAVATPEGWTEQRTNALQSVINTYPNE